MHERDLYLAWSCKRSKAVNGATSVVAVVGKGHLRGVCYALTHDAGGPGGRAAACSPCSCCSVPVSLRSAGAESSLLQMAPVAASLYSSAPNAPVLRPAAAAGAQLRFRDLVGGKNVKADRQRQRAAAVGRFALETALFGLLMYAWAQLQPAAQL